MTMMHGEKSTPPSLQKELKKMTVWIVCQSGNERCRKHYA